MRPTRNRDTASGNTLRTVWAPWMSTRKTTSVPLESAPVTCRDTLSPTPLSVPATPVLRQPGQTHLVCSCYMQTHFSVDQRLSSMTMSAPMRPHMQPNSTVRVWTGCSWKPDL